MCSKSPDLSLVDDTKEKLERQLEKGQWMGGQNGRASLLPSQKGSE